MTTLEIERLEESGRDLVESDDRFPHEPGSTPPDDLAAHVTTHEVTCVTGDPETFGIDFDRLDEAVDAAVATFDTSSPRQRTAMDSALAPVVHQCIRIPTRVASLPGVWHYVTLFRYPELVTARWSRDDDLEEKFLGTQKDLYSNYVARLWWGAELTYDGDEDHYFDTHRLFNKQRVVNYVLDSSFRRYRPAARAFAVALSDATNDVIDGVGRQFNQSLSTIQVEAREQWELEDQLRSIREHVE